MTRVDLMAICAPQTNGNLNVFFGPRFTYPVPPGSDSLKHYEDWRDWPNTLSQCTLRAVFEDSAGNTHNAPMTATGPTPSSDIWKALFGDWQATPNPTTVPVLPYQYTRRTDHDVDAWDGSAAVLALTSFYQGLADAFPSNPPMGNNLGSQDFTTVLNAAQDLRDYVKSKLQPGQATPASQVPSNTNTADYRWTMGQMIAVASQHPHLMKLLGLVQEYTVNIPNTPDPIVAIGVQFTAYPGIIPTPAPPPTITRNFIPNRTRVFNNTTIMRTANQGLFKMVGAGWLDFNEWILSGVDAAHTSSMLKSWEEGVQSDKTAATPPPATRGITILKDGSPKTDFEATLTRQDNIEAAVQAGTLVYLLRDDMTMGFRVDVKDDTLSAPWRSLFQRRAIDPTNQEPYRFPFDSPSVGAVPDDEGWVAPAMTTEAIETAQRPNPESGDSYVPTAPQRISEVLHVWDGWSGAVPRPGRMMRGDGVVADPDANENDANNERPQVGVRYQVVPGTLPQLRYGHSYQFRARAIDLTGGGIPASNQSPPTAAISDKIVFGRTHQIPSPSITRQTALVSPGVGDTATTMVIKSELGQTTGIPTTERIIFPPVASQVTCERHGVPGDGDDPTAYAELAARDALGLTSQTTEDPLTSEPIASPVGANPNRPDVEFLADPAVRELVMHNLPGTTGTTRAPLAGTWPLVDAWRISLHSGSGAPKVDVDADNSIIFAAPQATIQNIELSCSPWTPADFYVNQGTSGSVAAALAIGRQWLASARTRMQIVHAVRVPLTLPLPKNLSATRPLLERDSVDPAHPETGLGSLAAHITLDVGVHHRSTGSVQCTGTWVDPVDEGPGGPTPGMGNSRSNSFGRLTADYHDTADLPGTDMVLEMRDTKAHDVDVTVEAFSRYSEYFTEDGTFTFASSAVVIDARGVVPASVLIKTAGGTPIGREHYLVDRAACTVDPVPGGDLEGESNAVVRWIPLPVSRMSDDLGVIRPTVVIPASAPPDKPEVIEVLPSVARDVRTTDGVIRVRHSGQVLRLHMQRPWWTSGRNEQLAMILNGPANDHYTLVGRDPIFEGTGPNAHTAANRWRRAVTEGVFDGVTIAGHDVTFDTAKDLWVCDVELDADVGYRPFLLPVVARFQPDALADAHFSPRVVLDPHRLGVYREVEITPGDSSVKVSVIGPDNPGVELQGGTSHNRIRIQLQEQEAGVADTELAWQDVGSSLELNRFVRGDGWSRWNGKLRYPAAGSGPYRLLIEEVEPSIRETSPGVTQIAWDIVYVETQEL